MRLGKMGSAILAAGVQLTLKLLLEAVLLVVFRTLNPLATPFKKFTRRGERPIWRRPIRAVHRCLASIQRQVQDKFIGRGPGPNIVIDPILRQNAIVESHPSPARCA